MSFGPKNDDILMKLCFSTVSNGFEGCRMPRRDWSRCRQLELAAQEIPTHRDR